MNTVLKLEWSGEGLHETVLVGVPAWSGWQLQPPAQLVVPVSVQRLMPLQLDTTCLSRHALRDSKRHALP